MNMTISLAGSEVKAEFSGANAWLRNDGADVIYAAAKPGITAGADGVVAIPAGQSAPVYGANGAVWLTGTGSVQLIGSDYSTNPFKTSAQAGGSGADDVARAAISAHSGNADIHVTAAEKSAWSGKAELSDIPTTLPANGGNADTVGNKGISQILAIKGWFDGDMDDLKEQGSYIANEATNMPISGGWGTVLVFAGGTGSVVQVFTDYVTSTSDLCKTYIRHFTGDLWSTWVNIADGGNADTLDGKHASDFSQIISFGDTSTDTKTATGIPYKTTIYWCQAWTDYPAELKDGQGVIIAVNYKSASDGNIWCRQFYIAPAASAKIYQRSISGTSVGEWTNIADGGNAASVGGKTITVTDVDPGAGAALNTGEIVFVTEVT